jgi:hypothetical protein
MVLHLLMLPECQLVPLCLDPQWSQMLAGTAVIQLEGHSPTILQL